MKRIITLLFALLYTSSALNGMQADNIHDLPGDIHNEITTMALATNSSPDEAIKAIKAMSVLRGTYYDNLFNNLKSFTELVHLLAQKFNARTEDIAQKFETKVAQQYMDLGKQLIKAVYDNDIAHVIELIKQNADVNYMNGREETPLIFAIIELNPEMVQLLLDAGADPQTTTVYGTPLDRLQWNIRVFKGHRTPEIIKIEKILQRAQA